MISLSHIKNILDSDFFRIYNICSPSLFHLQDSYSYFIFNLLCLHWKHKIKPNTGPRPTEFLTKHTYFDMLRWNYPVDTIIQLDLTFCPFPQQFHLEHSSPACPWGYYRKYHQRPCKKLNKINSSYVTSPASTSTSL